MLSIDSEPSAVRDYYLTLRRRGRGAPDAVAEVIDDFMEELRTAVAQQQPYNERHHRVRLGLPPSVQMNESLLPRSALVRRFSESAFRSARSPGRGNVDAGQPAPTSRHDEYPMNVAAEAVRQKSKQRKYSHHLCPNCRKEKLEESACLSTCALSDFCRAFIREDMYVRSATEASRCGSLLETSHFPWS